jgi:hypothetical protein
VNELFDLFDKKIVGMINQQFKANRVQNDTFQEQNAFLEFEKLFPFGIQHSS